MENEEKKVEEQIAELKVEEPKPVEENAPAEVKEESSQPVEEKKEEESKSEEPKVEEEQPEEKKEEENEYNFSPEEYENVKKMFNELDKDGNGALDKDEYRSLLEKTLKRKISDLLFRRYLEVEFNLADEDGNGTIDFNEFCKAYKRIFTNPDIPIHFTYKKTESRVHLETGENAPSIVKKKLGTLTEEQMADCRAKFDHFDDNKNGLIEKEELRALLLETLPNNKMSNLMINRMVEAQFQLFDTDDSGSIEFEEFIHLYAKIYVNKEAIGLPFK